MCYMDWCLKDLGWYRGVVINIFVFLEFVYKYKWIIFLFIGNFDS